MFPHGLTNSPTQSNQRGVGLEPTACGRGKFLRVLSPRKGVKPFALPRSVVATSVASCLREGGEQVFGLRPWPLGLSPCCDYSIARFYLFVNTFLKKTFLFFSSKRG